MLGVTMGFAAELEESPPKTFEVTAQGSYSYGYVDGFMQVGTFGLGISF